MPNHTTKPPTTATSNGPGAKAQPSAGKRSLVEQLATPAGKPAQPVGAAAGSDAAVHASAQDGIATPSSSLPHADAIQRSFGSHDISGIQAHAGPEAAASAGAMGAQAYATGNHVVLGGATDLHTVAHEAAHVVQQRAGVQLKGGVGAAGDAHEQHADEVANRVVRGESAEDLLAPYAGGGGKAGGGAGPVQMVRESEFRGDPAQFLKQNLLSLTMVDGMLARGEADKLVEAAYPKLVKKLGEFDRHWFKLVPDAARTKEGRPAYHLTPAIERYIEQYPDDELLTTLRDHPRPAREGDESYLPSAYVDYKNIGVKEPDETIGHTEITRDRGGDGDWNPDLVFTAAMNGCAFTVTPAATDDKFTAWHFQSPESNRAQAASFRQDKAPSDWYGADEYDKGDHPGLFEVTNLMHRNADNQWNVVSQQNETGKHNLNDVTTRAVEQRPLDTRGGGDRGPMIKRIYSSLQRTKTDDLVRAARNASQYIGQLDPALKGSVSELISKVTQSVSAEDAILARANTVEQLHAAAGQLLELRRNNARHIKQGADALAEGLRAAIAQENKKYALLKDKKKVGDLELCRSNVEAVGKYVLEMSWMTELQSETAH
ncbi:MAG TPA: DUF4157 domain-containing protein [Kofleriaceae bacterium]